MDRCIVDVGRTFWTLERDRVGPVRVLVREHGVLAPYDDVDAEPGAIAAVLGHLDADVLLLRAIPQGSALLDVPSIRRLAVQTETACSLDLGAYDSVEAWLRSRSKGRRRSLRRGLKALGASWSFEELTDPGERRDAIEDAIALKRVWLAERGTFSRSFSDPSFRRDVLEHWGPADPSRVVLRIAAQGATAAVELGLQHGDTYRAYMGAFSPRFDGAGVVMTHEAVRRAMDNGLATYDLLAPKTQFKTSWMDIETPIFSAVVPLTSAGRLAAPALRNGPTLAKRAVRFGERLLRGEAV